MHDDGRDEIDARRGGRTQPNPAELLVNKAEAVADFLEMVLKAKRDERPEGVGREEGGESGTRPGFERTDSE